MIIRWLNCCGVKEISQLSIYGSARDFMLAFVTPKPYASTGNEQGNYTSFCYESLNKDEEPYFLRCGFLLFTEARQQGYGQKLADFIYEHKLGTITTSEVRQNKNSGNLIQVFLWGVDYEALKKWKNENWVPAPAPVKFAVKPSFIPLPNRINKFDTLKGSLPAPGRLPG